MKTDRQLQQDIMDELAFDPSVKAPHIGVSVEDQVVTLSGSLESFAEKYAAERAVFRVAGVRAVANAIQVELPDAQKRSDVDLARAAAAALEWNVIVPRSVNAIVEEGHLYLRGEAHWEFQRQAAFHAVKDLIGIKQISNEIILKEVPKVRDVKSKIEKALLRLASYDARQIKVSVAEGKVILDGHVHSQAEINDAKWAAWSVPGVQMVESHLVLT